MKEAIQKAIKGGYKPRGLTPLDFAFVSTGAPDKKLNQLLSVILLDPLFWQCLGKKVGWSPGGTQYGQRSTNYDWLHHWHRFIDRIADGGTPDDFFKELLGGTDL